MVMTKYDDVAYFLTLYTSGHTQDPKTDIPMHVFVDDLIALLDRFDKIELIELLRKLREHK